MLKQRPLGVWRLPLWTLKGKAQFKKLLATSTQLNVATLPYHDEIVAYAEQAREQGREVVLATATDITVANAVAAHLGVFSRVLASDGDTNLSGAAKLETIREALGTGQQFEYVGNAMVDMPIWSGAARAVVVGGSPLLERRIRRTFPTIHSLPIARARPTLRTYAKAIRLHQWVKNLLVFLPLLLAHRLTDGSSVVAASIGFLAFSLTASAIYILNDLLDLEDDRVHASKRFRPFARGTVPITHGIAIAFVFATTAMAMAAVALPTSFGVLLGVYVLLTTAYSFWLKQVAIVDVIMLSSLYTLRIFAGGAAASVYISEWLIGFSVFFFFSLAMAKRRAELSLLKPDTSARGRDYSTADAPVIENLGGASGLVSVLVLALYINGDDVQLLYSRPAVLWPIALLLLYWITRIWLLASRGELHDDPIVFAIRDRTSYVVGLCAAALIILASL